MKYYLPLLILFAAVVNRLDAQVTPSPTTGETVAPGSVTMSGTVVAEGTRRPLPYSTVRLLPLGREKFTDQAGAFTYFSVAPGKYDLRVRQVGYVPHDTTIDVKANVPVILSITLSRIAIALDEVRVVAPPRLCLVPDDFGSVPDSELSVVLGEARKTAEREQLLRNWYPFEYKIAQTHDTYDVGRKRHTLQYDTVVFRSDDSWRYRRGRVVSSDRSKLFGDIRLMRLPTLTDLADRNFLSNHCFKYSGVVDQNGVRAHRIDFLPDSLLVAPDVQGSIFVDSATYKIRRAEFRLTHGGTVSPPILGMEVTTIYREILPNVALFDEIRSVQPLITQGGSRIESHETQHLLSFRFLVTSPPGVTGHKWIAVGSMTADSLANLDSLRSGRRPSGGPARQDKAPKAPESPPSKPFSNVPAVADPREELKHLM